MTHTKTIMETLDRVGELCADPSGKIYERLFEMHPEVEELFVLDTDGGVRGSMVQEGLECIIDYVESGQMAPLILAAGRDHHVGYGVPEDLYGDFFTAIRDAFRTILAGEWTAQRDAAWSDVLAGLRKLT